MPVVEMAQQGNISMSNVISEKPRVRAEPKLQNNCLQNIIRMDS